MRPRDAIFWAALLVGGGLALIILDGHVLPAPNPMGPPPKRKRPQPREPPLVVKDDVEVLARAIVSEIGTGSLEQKVAVAWAVRNFAGDRGKPIWELLCNPCGRQEQGREVSTRLEATAEARAIAAEVLATPIFEDPTGGATQFVDPRVADYPAIRKRWREEYKWAPYRRIGKELELWGPPKTQ
jgi:hypothetical protein